MAFLEGNWFIDAGEYDRYRSKRVAEIDITPDEIYTVMLKLASRERAAAKMTARLINKIRQSSLVTVELQFLDDDFNPTNKASSQLVDDFMEGIGKSLAVKD